MAKTSGGVRTLKVGSRNYQNRSLEVAKMRESGLYSSVTFSTIGGGYVAIEASPLAHTEDELDAARILADKGYKVILKNEANFKMNVKTVDGYLFNASYEQRTPTNDSATTIKNALGHARDKKADIAVIYSKNNAFSRYSVDKGLEMYEQASKYRFKEIIVVSSSGNIHRRKHNDR